MQQPVGTFHRTVEFTLPQNRLDKVLALRAAIERGTYSIPASAVADKMILAMLRGSSTR